MNKKYIFIILILLILCASCSNNKINKQNDIDNENNTINQSIKKDNSEKYKCNISRNTIEKKSFKDAKFLDESYDNYSIEYPNYDHGDGYLSSYNIGTNHIFYAVE